MSGCREVSGPEGLVPFTDWPPPAVKTVKDMTNSFTLMKVPSEHAKKTNETLSKKKTIILMYNTQVLLRLSLV